MSSHRIFEIRRMMKPLTLFGNWYNTGTCIGVIVCGNYNCVSNVKISLHLLKTTIPINYNVFVKYRRDNRVQRERGI